MVTLHASEMRGNPAGVWGAAGGAQNGCGADLSHGGRAGAAAAVQ